MKIFVVNIAIFILLENLFLEELGVRCVKTDNKRPRITYISEPQVNHVAPSEFRDFVIRMTTDRRWKEKNARSLLSTSVVPKYSEVPNLINFEMPNQQNFPALPNLNAPNFPTMQNLYNNSDMTNLPAVPKLSDQSNVPKDQFAMPNLSDQSAAVRNPSDQSGVPSISNRAMPKAVLPSDQSGVPSISNQFAMPNLSDQSAAVLNPSNQSAVPSKSKQQPLAYNISFEYRNMPTLSSLTVPNQQKKNWTSEANMQGHKRPIDETEHYITATSALNNEKDQTESKRVFDIRLIFELSLSALGILPIYIHKPLAYVIKGSSMELPSVQKQFEMLSKILRQMDAKIVEPRVKENLLGCEMAKNGTFFGQIFKKIQKQGIDVFGHNLFETDQNEEQSVKRGEILFFYMKFYNKLVKLLESEYYGTDKNTTELRLGLHKWIRAAKECVAGEFQQFFKMAREHRLPNSQLFPH